MDSSLRWNFRNSIKITGWGHEISPTLTREAMEKSTHETMEKDAQKNDRPYAWDCKPLEYLKVKKTLKYMSKQDRLALSAAGKALAMAQITKERLQERTGLFLCVGYIPFPKEEAETLARNSEENGTFSMRRFSSHGYPAVNPLLTFACLPNMPAYHISANFDLHGEYFVTYPDTLEMYVALWEAVMALTEGRIDVALVGGVADQCNFLVENHFRKIRNSSEILADGACFLVLEKENDASKCLAHLVSLERIESANEIERIPDRTSPKRIGAGPMELPLNIAWSIEGRKKEYRHRSTERQFIWESQWEASCVE